MTKNNDKRIGIKEIAKKAGVSIGTVDRVLHMRGDVSEATKSKVMQIVHEYGYTPNVIARTLSSKKKINIGIVIPDSSDHNPYWEMPIQGISKAAAELSRFNTGISYEFFDASDESSFREAFDKVIAKSPDGLVINPVFGHNSMEQINQLDQSGMPYVSIEINVEGIDKRAHFGQDARQSGRVAASLLETGLPGLSDVLILKQTSKKIFSKHIESRISGFLEYFSEIPETEASQADDQHHDVPRQIRPIIVEIDLLLKGEPATTLEKTLAQYPDIKAVFIPNSRAFLFADFIEKRNLDGYFVVGYDIIEQNIKHLKKGTISFLIGQRPHVQAYNAIMALSEHLLTGKKVAPTNYSQIDIINKENLAYYKTN